MLAEQEIGVVVLAKNGEARLLYDSCLEIKAEGKWTVHHDPNSRSSTDFAELRDLSC
jgi:hypothetical protein